MRAPFSKTSSPSSTELTPASIRRRVVLPAPLRPASVMRSPRSSLNETPRNRGAPATSLPSADAITTATGRIVTYVAHASPSPRHPGRVGPRAFAYRNQEGPQSPDALVAELAGRQHGVVSSAQMRAAGLTGPGIRRRVQARRLYPLHRGVYAVGHQALSWRAHLLAAVYAWARGACESPRGWGPPRPRAVGPHRGHRGQGRQAKAGHHGPPLPPGRRIGPLWRQCRSPASPARSSTSPMS